MIKKLFIIAVFIFGFCNIIFANVYDLSQIDSCKTIADYDVDTSVEEMDTIRFGKINYETRDLRKEVFDNGSISYWYGGMLKLDRQDMEWLVLEKQTNKVLLLSKYLITGKPFNDKMGEINWENSSIRKWLNEEFYNTAFNNIEKQKIMSSTIENKYNKLNNEVDLFGEKITNGIDTIDKVFLLNLNEIVKYFRGYNNKCVEVKELNYSYNILIFSKNLCTTYYGEDCFNTESTLYWLRDITKGQAANEIYIDRYYYGNGTYEKYLSGDSRVVTEEGIRPALWVNLASSNSQSNGGATGSLTNNSVGQNNETDGGVIPGLPSRQSELRSDNHFYLDNNMQRNSWVYYISYYYHVDEFGNIEKSKWIEQRYVGADGRMYRGRQTPDGYWVGDDGLIVDSGTDLSISLTIEDAEPDSWYRTQSGLWYYFENDRTTTKRGWFHDERDNQWYYLDPRTGIMVVGWKNIDGNEYYFNESHNNEKNWYETGGGFYESYNKKIKAYGSMFVNEQTPDGRYVDVNGRLIN